MKDHAPAVSPTPVGVGHRDRGWSPRVCALGGDLFFQDVNRQIAVLDPLAVECDDLGGALQALQCFGLQVTKVRVAGLEFQAALRVIEGGLPFLQALTNDGLASMRLDEFEANQVGLERVQVGLRELGGDPHRDRRADPGAPASGLSARDPGRRRRPPRRAAPRRLRRDRARGTVLAKSLRLIPTKRPDDDNGGVALHTNSTCILYVSQFQDDWFAFLPFQNLVLNFDCFGYNLGASYRAGHII